MPIDFILLVICAPTIRHRRGLVIISYYFSYLSNEEVTFIFIEFPLISNHSIDKALSCSRVVNQQGSSLSHARSAVSSA